MGYPSVHKNWYFILQTFDIFYIGGVVLSICSGSGSTMEAAMQVGRSCLALDADGMISRMKPYLY